MKARIGRHKLTAGGDSVAIIRTITSGSAEVRIDDSCLRGVSAEEIARRQAELDRLIHRINRDAEREKG